MTSKYNLQKQVEQISKTQKVWEPVLNQIAALNSAKTLSTALEIVSESLDIENTAKVAEAALGAWSSQTKKKETLLGIGVANLFSVHESAQKILASIDFSSILSSVQIPDFSEGVSAALKAYDASIFSSTIQGVFHQIDWSNEINVSDIVESVTEQYIEDNELDEDASKEIGEVVEIRDRKHLTAKQRKVWEVYIYPILGSFLISLFFHILSLQSTQPTKIYNIVEVNNYYTNELGVDANTLNEYSFRIICEDDVMPRIKPDCSSRVVEHLPAGKIVCIVKRFKKWIQITWQNDAGEYCSGWVQNYKVQKFQ